MAGLREGFEMRHESENRLDSMMDAAIDQAIAVGQEKDLENAAITLFLKGRDDVELASFQENKPVDVDTNARGTPPIRSEIKARADWRAFSRSDLRRSRWASRSSSDSLLEGTCVDALRGSRAFLAWDCHVGCRFVSGLFTRPMAAGLDGLSASRGSHLDFALDAHPLAAGLPR